MARPLEGKVMVCTIELEIGAGSRPSEFVTRVVHAVSGGEPSASMHLDVDGLLRNRDALENTVLLSAVPRRLVRSGGAEQLRQVGQQLFEALFKGEVRDAYRASKGAAAQQGKPLRVVLRLTAPRLAALPWEALFDPEIEAHICRREPLVRHVSAPYAREPTEVDPPLHVLGVVASPRGMPRLDVAAEQERLSKALAGPIREGLVELEWLVQASWKTVQEVLLSNHWHVLHFIGHGDYDVTTDQGMLALVGEDGRANLVEAERLADLLNEARPTPRLVVLNSCSSGEEGTQDLFSGTAAALVRSGISAVAAMQFTISDPAAIDFATGFYTAIAHGRSVDDAVRSGRISILGRPHTLEWVTPVLYVRGDSTQLFTLTSAARKGRLEKRLTQALPMAAVAQPPTTAPPEGSPTSAVKQGIGTLFRSKVESKGRRWDLKTIAITIAVFLTTVTAITALAFLIWGGKEGPSLSHGHVMRPEGWTSPDIPIYAEPKRSSKVVGNVSAGTTVYIFCVTNGESVVGPLDGVPTATSLWNKVRTEEHGPNRGFMPDAWVDTGGSKPRANVCDL
ncbi:hypothetical protein A5692_14080 [Mycobacterium sp. E342]|uniref:CHAT domain-containing protein n=1 Tax=Mycobacterium sp. E342 TaxID=1834147 RepID=UPI0007FCB5A1|nr:CHAT domain-containing protein [Mycobacterium sp. E342]OBH33536.1 hypothetical protein A5692_14080 [Mycobacterium sp. E342]